MAEVADLFVRLRAETSQFTSGMVRAGETGESFTARMGGLSGMLTKVGRATTAVGIGFVAYGVKAAGDFQQQMNLLVTACGESQSNLKLVSDGVLSLARSTGTSTGQLADGMYQVEKAGYRGADGLKVLKAAAQGAREEGADLKDVTNAMTSVMASYHLKASDSVRVMNAIKTAAGEGKMTMQEFSSSLATVIPIASANKVSFAEVGGAIATLTQHGTSAREATQELASTIRNLASPNNVAVQEMQRLGLSSTDVATKLGQRGLTGTLDLLSQTVLSKMGPSGTILLSAFNQTKQAAADADAMVKNMPPSLQKLAQAYATGAISLGDWRQKLKTLPPEQANLLSQYGNLQNKTTGFAAELKRGGPAAQTYTEAIKKMTGGAIGLNTTLQLTGENTAGFKDRVGKVSESFNHASKNVEGWDVTQRSFNVQMGRLKETIVTTAITVGTRLLPVISASISFFAQHQDAAVALALVFGGVLTAAVTAFAVNTITGAVKGVADLGRGLVTGGRAVLAFASSQRMAAAAARAMAIAQAALNLVMSANPIVLIVLAVLALVAAFVYAYTHFESFRQIVQTVFHAITEAVSFVINFVKSHWKLLIGLLLGPFGLILAGVITYWSQIKSAVTTAVRTVISFVKEHWPLLVALLTGPIGIAVLAIVRHWHEITAGFSAAYRATVNVGRSLLSWVGALPGRVRAGLAALGGMLSSLAHSAWSRFASAAHDSAESLLDWVRQLPGSLRTALGNLGSLLYKSGEALLNGFIEGIKSKAGSLKHALGGVLSSARNLLPFSPAHEGPFSGRGWTEYSGQALMNGLAQGIHAGSDTVAGRMHHALARAAGIAQNHPAITPEGFTRPLTIRSTERMHRTALTGTAIRGDSVVVHHHYSPHITVQGSVLSEHHLRDVVETQMLRLGMRSSTTYTPYKR